MFQPDYDLAQLTPAAYNPRAIADEAKLRLQESLRALGVLKALIARDNGTLVAGHQRLNAMRAIGIDRAPVYVLTRLSDQDEIRFNQLHNGADIEADADVRVAGAGELGPGWHSVPAAAIQVIKRPRHAAKLTEILRLLAKFGEWGNSIACVRGQVLASPLYAIACSILRLPLRVVVVPDDLAVSVAAYFGESYGEYSYQSLPEATWGQTLAQMRRLRGEAGDSIKSRTYERLVLPAIRRGQRILDFGAGQKDYVKRLQREGHDIHGVEFYFRTEKALAFDVPQVHEDISRLCRDLADRGRYDVVICDSVLNSVTDNAAERHVLTAINALCRPGGLLVFSGRSRDFIERISSRLSHNRGVTERRVFFVDADGFCAMFNQGVWLRQKFHRRRDVEKLCELYVGPTAEISDSQGLAHGEFRASAWGVRGIKQVERPAEEAEAALGYEFNLPLPGGRRYGRSGDIIRAWRTALAVETAQNA